MVALTVCVVYVILIIDLQSFRVEINCFFKLILCKHLVSSLLQKNVWIQIDLFLTFKASGSEDFTPPFLPMFGIYIQNFVNFN